MNIRTDLAIEAKESYEGTNVEISGVVLNEEYKGNVKVTTVIIETDDGAEAMGKPIGHYLTFEADRENITEAFDELSQNIKELLDGRKKILVVGLGNREATPDALGPRTIDNIDVSSNGRYTINAIAPGVMAQTGMETAFMLKGIINEVKPDVVIAIDSLAARSAKRLINTIQVSDTGINPGSGVGNHRTGLCRETLGVDVIAIGIPTVIESATIVNDTLDSLHEYFPSSIKTFTHNEKIRLIRELLEPRIGELYVTPKDIDEYVTILGQTISRALNMIWT